MDEPFLPNKLSSATKTHLSNLPEDEEISFQFSPSLKNRIIYGDCDDPIQEISSDPSEVLVQPPPDPSNQVFPMISHRKTNLHRSRTAPAMAAMRDLKPQIERPKFESNSIIKQAVILLLIYVSLGVIAYWFNRDNFSGEETNPVVDALYFCIVTMCTIGYGDITPQTSSTKVFACLFVLIGFGFIDILLSGMVTYVLDLQENLLLSTVRAGHHQGAAKNLIVDVEKGRMRIRMKVGLALVVVILCVGIGTVFLHFVEKLNWVDCFYLSVMSVTTVGYGDRAFKTLPGRLFASIWLLVSTLAVARAFLYLAEARIDKRHRLITKWALHRDMTVEDLLAADLNNNGFVRNDHMAFSTKVFPACIGEKSATRIFLAGFWEKATIKLLTVDADHCASKSEYVIFKLKEMGKIGEKDIALICTQFNRLDSNNSGKITLPNLLNSRR